MGKNNQRQKQVENEVLETIRGAANPSELSGVVERVIRNGTEAKTAREAIRALVDRGVLQVTLDWKLRLRDNNGNAQRA